MRTCWLVTVLVTVIGNYSAYAHKVKPEYPVDMTTPLMVISGVEQLMNRLDNLEAKVDHTAKSSILQLMGSLNGQLSDFKTMVGENINQPLNNLSIEIRNQALKLDNTVKNFQNVLGMQMTCFFRQTEAITAATQTAALQVVSNLRFIGKKNEPLVQSIRFDGHKMYFVPENGGRATVFGFRLYEDLAPLVRVVDTYNRVIASTMNVTRSSSNDNISLFFPASMIRANRGKVLYIEITPRTKNLILWEKEYNVVRVPLVIPKAETEYKYFVKAFVDYKWTSTRIYELSDQKWSVYHENRSCENGASVSGSYHWNLPPNTVITNVRTSNSGGRWDNHHYDRNDGFVTRVTSANTIEYTASFGKAHCTCGIPFLGCKFHSHAFWGALIWPEVRETVSQEESDSTTSTRFRLTEQEMNFQLHIPVKSEDRTQTLFRYEIYRNDGTKTEKLFVSPSYEASASGLTAPTYNFKTGYTLDAIMVNKTVKGKVEVNISIKLPYQCPI